MVLDYFKKISDIPRGSGFNTYISNYLAGFAEGRGFKYIQDSSENVIIFKPASRGYEECPPLILQGHMDMVCEKENGSTHDFKSEGIRYSCDGNYITADGTTLGADDGIALAYMLEFLADDNMTCPPMEMVFTTDEETGMEGAINLDAGVLRGKHMINLDSEDEKGFVIACAGGRTLTTTIPVNREDCNGIKITIRIAGLKGGHSGTDIGRNRSNAVILLGRILVSLPSGSFGLIDMQGGNRDNVIPNEAYADIVAAPDRIADIEEMCGKLAGALSEELSLSEPGIEVTITRDESGKERDYKVLDGESYMKVIRYLTCVPNGVQVMSSAIPGMVESSDNLGIFRIADDCARAVVSIRSQKPSYIGYMTEKLRIMAESEGAVMDVSSQYPGYDMTPMSEFRDIMCGAYEDVFGRKPELSAIHAGLEIGVFAEKIPGLDIISIGPDTYDIHTVDERLDIKSVERVEKFLRKAVESYCSITMKHA